jgi:hypothetical protein
MCVCVCVCVCVVGMNTMNDMIKSAPPLDSRDAEARAEILKEVDQRCRDWPVRH